jgi:hypothetical protein
VDLVEYAHGVVTARGTAGIEYTGIGLRVVVGSPTPYTAHGFVNFAKSEKEYLDLLTEMHRLPKPTRKQQEDALIFSATTFAHPLGQLRYPYGHWGGRLYRGLPAFVQEHRAEIESEIQSLTNWVYSGHDRYHTWTVLGSVKTARTDACMAPTVTRQP